MRKTIINITFAVVFLVVVTIQVTQANPRGYFPHTVIDDVSPPDGVQAPIINIQTPQNGSIHPKNVTLTYNVVLPETNGNITYGISELSYKGNWNPEVTIIIPKDKFGAFPNSSFVIDLSDVRGGDISITVFTVCIGLIPTGSEVVDSSHSYNYYDRFEVLGYSTVSFYKDIVPPQISVLSPQNATYTSQNVPLKVAANEAVFQVIYSLDNQENQTVTGNYTLTGVPNGQHSVTLYVLDLAGNAASPKTILFNVNSPEPFPIVLASAISLIALCVGLLVYFKKSKR